MTIRYVGPGGSDGASGLTWVLRKLTLNGVEDTPVVAGDTVYVGPGTYRETLTVDITGSSGTQIEYIADVMGINTDGVGGQVRITGSNDDESSTRSRGIESVLTTYKYRTFRGFRFDLCSSYSIYVVGGDGWNIEDCVFMPTNSTGGYGIYHLCAGGMALTVRRCFFNTSFIGLRLHGTIYTEHSSLYENCVFFGCGSDMFLSQNTWGWTIRNCSFIEGSYTTAIRLLTNVENDNCYGYNNFFFCRSVYNVEDPNVFIEDHSYVVSKITASSIWGGNVSKGTDSIIRPYGNLPRLLLDGFYIQQDLLAFAAWSGVQNYGCGNSPPSEDFYGMTRPTTDSKKTRGAIQFSTPARETTTVPSGETESLKMSDAMPYQIFIPVTGNQMSFSVEVHRQSNYAGTNPQMIIKQPGQSDRITTDASASGQFNELSDTFTPASSPPYVVMEIKSNNTATSGNYGVFWGAFEVK